MDNSTADALLALNRKFYDTFAQEFSASRAVSDPALTSILPYVPPAATVLDVGCGNGRLGVLLARERPGSYYLGIDAVPSLTAVARGQLRQLKSITWDVRIADISQAGWSHRAVGWRKFDCVVALAVLHHVPGQGRRVQVLREMAGTLECAERASPARLVLATWQFLDSPRLRRKVVSWEEAGLCEDDVDPGDYLLDWQRGGRGLRYVHLVDEHEMNDLAAQAGLRVSDTFRAGGREGNLSLYSILEL